MTVKLTVWVDVYDIKKADDIENQIYELLDNQPAEDVTHYNIDREDK